MTPAEALTLRKHDPVGCGEFNALGYVASVASDGHRITVVHTAFGQTHTARWPARDVRFDGPRPTVRCESSRVDSPWLKEGP